MCTFEECDLKLFEDRHSWFRHELEFHRLEWCCRFCSHPPFGSETKLSTHMRHQHVQFAARTQLPALLKASRQSTDRISPTACPLCHWDVTLKEFNTHTPSDEVLVVTPIQFRQHLGAHMEQLALFALPRSYKNEEKDADSNEAAVMIHSDAETQHSSTEKISWKTVSSRGKQIDSSIPDVSTGIATHSSVHTTDLYPWSKHALINVNPLPRWGAAMGQLCSNEGRFYIQGGLIEGVTVKSDCYMIESEGRSMACSLLETKLGGPGPRVGHAAILVGNAFIIFGGDTAQHSSDPLDESHEILYLLNISEFIQA